MTKKATIYARVSTDEQREQTSIQKQVGKCQIYATQHNYQLVGDSHIDTVTGYDVTADHPNAVLAYADDASGTTLDRPKLNNLKQYLQNAGFDVLLVQDVERLTRGGAPDFYTLMRHFDEYHVSVEFVDDQLAQQYSQGDDNPILSWLSALPSVLAKDDNLKRVKKLNEGKIGLARFKGQFVGAGKTPYGYKLDRDAKGGLAINETQAVVVRLIFRWFVNDKMSIRGIATKLTEQRRVNHSGNIIWGKSTVAGILSNEVYIGKAYYNRLEKINGKDKKRQNRDEIVQIEVTPIIKKELFRETQKRLAENRATIRKRPSQFFMLSGLIKCSGCGRAYTSQMRSIQNRHRDDPYQYRHRRAEHGCINRAVAGVALENDVWHTLVNLLTQPENLEAGYTEALAQQQREYNHLINELDLVNCEISKLQAQQTNLTLAYADPEIALSKSDYIALRQQTQSVLNNWLERKTHLQQELSLLPQMQPLADLQGFMAEVIQALENGNDFTPEEKREIFNMLNLRVMISPNDERHIEGWFAPTEVLLAQAVKCSDNRLKIAR